ncbi:MAG: phosphatase PAP2 family protein [Bacteroidetes bacterium]|nr:phosphatase PAP2 family protein [Bacteroidota bacterium]
MNLNTKIFLTLNGFHSDIMDQIMLAVSNTLLYIPFFIFLIFIARRYFKKQESDYLVENTVLLGTILAIQFMVCFFLVPAISGNLVHLERPCHNEAISPFIRLVGESCDSNGHYFAVRPCLTWLFTSFFFFTMRHHFRLIKWLFVIWSVIVCYSRIYLGVHYPSSVLYASLIGILFGYLGSKLYFYLKYNVLVL